MTDYILIVDDNPDVRMLLTDAITMLGLQVKTAEHGKEALEWIAKETPKLIVLDLMMPIMDGFTTLTNLQKTKEGRKIPVILLSAIADPHNKNQNLPGVVGIMKKGDFSLDKLRAMLKKVGVLGVGAVL